MREKEVTKTKIFQYISVIQEAEENRVVRWDKPYPGIRKDKTEEEVKKKGYSVYHLSSTDFCQ